MEESEEGEEEEVFMDECVCVHARSCVCRFVFVCCVCVHICMDFVGAGSYSSSGERQRKRWVSNVIESLRPLIVFRRRFRMPLDEERTIRWSLECARIVA